MKNNEVTTQGNYMKGFIPFAIAAAVLSLCGGFTAAVPASIAKSWGMGDSNATTWITLAFAFGSAGMAPIMGKLGDVLCRRVAILTGITIMALGELLIGICPDGLFSLLLIARFILGCGAATIAPVVISYILTEFPKDKIGKGFSIYMFIASAMVIFGPTLGGIVIKFYGWRLVMYLCVAFLALAFVLCMVMVKKGTPNKDGLAGFDVMGSVLVLIFFSLFLSIPSFGQSNGWTSKETLICVGTALVALVLMVMREKKAENPILNGRFMARKQFVLPVIALFLTQGLMQSCMTNIIVFVQNTQNDPTLSGIATSVMYVGMALGSIAIGPMADKKEPRVVAAAALVFVAIGAAIQMVFTGTTGLAIFSLSLFLIGLGLGGNATIFMKVALSGLDAASAGAGSGTYNMFRDMSAPFGVALFVPMFTSGMQQLMSTGVELVPAAVSAIHKTALVQVVCVVIGIVVCFMIPKIYNGEEKAQA